MSSSRPHLRTPRPYRPNSTRDDLAEQVAQAISNLLATLMMSPPLMAASIPERRRILATFQSLNEAMMASGPLRERLAEAVRIQEATLDQLEDLLGGAGR